MKERYKPILLTKEPEEHLLERYIENICNLNNISNELYGNIQFAVFEAVEILFSLSDNYNFKSITASSFLFPNGLGFILKAHNYLSDCFKSEDYIETKIRIHKMEKEFFIIKKLADNITILKDSPGIELRFTAVGLGYERVMERINCLNSFWEAQKTLKGV